jgi:hypothetical protein
MTIQLDHPAIHPDHRQLHLFGPGETVHSEHVPGIGRCLLTPGGGWRARYTGARYGWQIDRRITWLEPHHVWMTPWADEPELVLEGRADWEGWEPELPYGVEHITDRAGAVAALEQLVLDHGDDPHWLDRYHRAYARGA